MRRAPETRRPKLRNSSAHSFVFVTFTQHNPQPEVLGLRTLPTRMKLCLTLYAVLATVTSGFAPVATPPAVDVASSSSSTALAMAKDDDLLRWARSARSADNEDNVVELLRPLGLVLQEDENRNVYVETVAPKGNAARTGQVCILVPSC